MATLKPFVINLNDLLYLLEQVNFVPLFDGSANSNGIVDFDPLTMDAWDAKGNQVWNAATQLGSYQGTELTAANVALLGSGFPHVSSPIGVRDVSGLHNNLFGTQSDWGAVDVPFRRDVAANFDNYVTAQGTVKVAIDPDTQTLTVTYLDGITPTVTLLVGDYAPVDFSATDLASVTLNATATAVTFTYDSGTANPPVKVTLTGNAVYDAAMAGQTVTPNYGTVVGANGVVFQASVVDLMPRIISRTITTGDVNLLTDSAGHFVTWDPAKYGTDGTDGTDTAYGALINGAGIVPVPDPSNPGHYLNLVDGVKIVVPGGMSIGWDATANSASIQYRTLLTFIAANGVDDRLYGLDDPTNSDPAVRLPLTDGGPIFIMSTAANPTFGEPPGFTNLAGLTFDANLFLYNSLVVASGVSTAGLVAGDPIPLTDQDVADAISGLATLGTVAPAVAEALLDTSSGYGQLEALGHIDFQNPDTGEYFIGSENPGVAPVNSWFGIFGQFFDHGLDLIGKGGQGTSIKISFAADDPLYGAQGPNGPAFSISVGRATVAGADANGDPNYVNHTSPFIDQSQTYGSVDQITNLLREWVSTDGGVSYHAGIELFDGQSLVDTWDRRLPDGSVTAVHDTLPTLSELRQHVLDTDRVALTWDDVVDYRNRSPEGTALSGGNSGHALILDMNPRFDQAHLSPDDGDNLTAWDATVAASVEAAVATLSAAGATGSPDLIFSAVRDTNNAIINIQLDVTNGAGGSFLPNGTYTGASALAAWVDFSTFGIMTAPPGVDPLMVEDVRAAVGDLLMASVGDHYIAGDGRVNENFGLTSIHHVFHEEHNYQVENLKSWIYAHDDNNPGATDAHEQLHNWQDATAFQDDFGNYMFNAAGVTEVLDELGAGTGLFQANDDNIAWNADKMFEATKLIVEMEYQHAAVDQYARTVTPRIQEFVGYSTGVDPTVSLEYSQVAFRFGHSTIRETIDTVDPSGWMLGNVTRFALEKAFLNPQQYAESGIAAITLGLSRQQMNEVDEFITPALSQGLLGQPLDLPAINIARGRDLGIPTLNDFRAAISLAEYTSWSDYGANMVHPESLVNFIAAYSFSDPSGLTPIEVSQAKAQYIIDLANGAPPVAAADNPFGLDISNADAQAFLTNNAIVAPPNGELTVGQELLNDARMGFDQIDAWIGGMAEAHVPGGILGETFDAVFVAQIQSLMDGDRFYYLYRLFGTQLHEEVNNGQFKDIVERNTGLSHLNGSIFAYADKYYDFNRNADGLMPDGSVVLVSDNLDEHLYAETLAANAALGIFSDGGFSTGTNGNLRWVEATDYVRLPETLQFINDVRPELDPTQVHAEGTPTSGADSHEVIVATENRDYIHARAGDDTVYGEGGDDFLFGDGGIDRLYGGDGNDVLDGGEGPDLMDGGAGKDVLYGRGSGTEVGGFDQIVGGSGNDLVIGGEGIDKLSGGSGDDIIYGDGLTNPEMGNTDAFTHSGDGNDYMDLGASGDLGYAEEGDDYMVGGADQDLMQGGQGDDILRPGGPSQAINGGPDEVIGDDGFTNSGFDLIDFSDYAAGAPGVVADMVTQFNPLVAIDGNTPFAAWFQIEGVIGSVNDDTITGSEAINPAEVANPFDGSNWLIGASGSDTLQGKGGNDLLIGGSIRLDSLIGTYEDAFNASGTGNLTLGSTEWLADAMRTGGVGFGFDAEGNVTAGPDGYDNDTENAYTGASNQATGALMANGLIDEVNASGVVLDKHFTEMLRSRMFKDVVLGDGGSDGTADAAVFRGNRADYDVTEILFTDAWGMAITAYKITDLRAPDVVDAAGAPVFDGTDIVVGVESFRFADVELGLADILNAPPSIDQGNAIAISVAENTAAGTLVQALTAFDPDGPPLTWSIQAVDGIPGAGDGQFAINAATGEITLTVAAPDFETLAATSRVLTVAVTDGFSTDSIAVTVDITNVDEAATGALRITGYTSTNTSATLTALNTLSDPDGFAEAIPYQWQRLVAGNWVDIVDGNNASLVGQVNSTVRVTSSYIDAFGPKTVVSSETAFVTGSSGNNTLTGTTGDDFLIGLGGRDTLNGGDGHDLLDGGTGNDTMNGGLGNDIYVVNAAGDVTTEGIDAGIDTVRSSVARILGDNFENLSLTGTGNISGTGNALDNAITGNAANNTLRGNGGNDTLDGGGNANVTGDTAAFTGTIADYLFSIDALGRVEVTDTVGARDGADTLVNIERTTFGAGGWSLKADTAGSGTVAAATARELLIGGDGEDTFVFATTGTAGGANGNVNTRDTIGDFQVGDRIDFSAIDASSAAGNGTFNFLGELNGVAGNGDLGYRLTTDADGNAVTLVEGNINGSVAVEFQIVLLGHHDLTANDFIL